jgi:hypothetical protein
MSETPARLPVPGPGRRRQGADQVRACARALDPRGGSRRYERLAAGSGHDGAVKDPLRDATEGLWRRQGWSKRKREAHAQPSPDFVPVRGHDGRAYVVEVVPEGYPINDWGDGELLLMPIWWLRRRLLHRNRFCVIVHRKGTLFQGWNRKVEKAGALTLAEARDRAASRARDFQSRDER